MKCRYVFLAIVSVFLVAIAAREAGAAKLRVPALSQILRGGPQPTLPAAWSGIWSDADTIYMCSDPGTPVFTSSGLDTLCTGETYSEDPDYTLDCSGTTSDTNLDLTCTGSFLPDPKDPTCVAEVDIELHGVRTDEKYFLSATINTTFVPPFCYLSPDQCLIIETTATRIAPEPAECLTPALPSTWGKVKARYR